MNQYSVFSGAFADEIGQRFIRMMSVATENTFADLHGSTIHNPKKYRECLDRVSAWDPRLVQDELSELRKRYPDVEDCFKHVFLAYVKMMRGAANMKLMVSLPRIESFAMSFFVNFSRHTCMREGRYFHEASVLEQRVVCMDAIRDALFEYLSDDHVKLEDRSVVSEAQNVARLPESRPSFETPYRGPIHSSPAEEEPNGARDDASDASSSLNRARPERSRQPPRSGGSDVSVTRDRASDVSVTRERAPEGSATREQRAASDVSAAKREQRAGSDVSVTRDEAGSDVSITRGERAGFRGAPSGGRAGSEASSSHRARPASHDCDDEENGSRVISNVLEPIASDDEDEESVVGPDDSVSNADFATKQHIALQRYLGRQVAREAPIEENESDKSSRTSMSLSSVSINQNGTLTPKPAPPEPPAARRKAASDIGTRSASSHALEPRMMIRGGMTRDSFAEMTKGYDDDERLSETSMLSDRPKRAEERKSSERNRSPARSYVTHLTDEW